MDKIFLAQNSYCACRVLSLATIRSKYYFNFILNRTIGQAENFLTGKWSAIIAHTAATTKSSDIFSSFLVYVADSFPAYFQSRLMSPRLATKSTSTWSPVEATESTVGPLCRRQRQTYSRFCRQCVCAASRRDNRDSRSDEKSLHRLSLAFGVRTAM